MALDPKAEAALALHRFGLGPRPGAVNALASDPRGALIAGLDRPALGRSANAGCASSRRGAAARAAVAFQQARQEQRRAAAKAQKQGAEPKAAEPKAAEPTVAANASAAPEINSGEQARPNAAAPAARPSAGIAPQQIYLAEAKARLGAALETDIGLVERLAWFWSNHFCVSADKAGVRPIAGAFEREAIRTHVLGRFADMLEAVETHPAMLIYLDNARSIGPNSVAGRNRGRGLNEN